MAHTGEKFLLCRVGVLGLPLRPFCGQHIVDAMEGKISVQSEQGKTSSISVPATPFRASSKVDLNSGLERNPEIPACLASVYQEVIFDSFSREDNTRVQKTEGSGLGMAITKHIVDAMEGKISVQSARSSAVSPARPQSRSGPADSSSKVQLDTRRFCGGAGRSSPSRSRRSGTIPHGRR